MASQPLLKKLSADRQTDRQKHSQRQTHTSVRQLRKDRGIPSMLPSPSIVGVGREGPFLLKKLRLAKIGQRQNITQCHYL